MDIATERLEAFGTMELARRDGEFRLAADARERLERLGVKVRYTRTRWPKQARQTPPATAEGARP